MRRWITSLLIVISPLLAFGHSHYITTYSIQRVDKLWVLKVNIAQESLNKCLPGYFDGIGFEELTSSEYSAYAAKYFQDNICLTANENEHFRLGEAAVKIGQHQTNMIFELSHMPEDIETLAMEIYCFAKIPNQQHIVKVISDKPHSYVASKKNDFAIKIDFQNTSA